ALKAWTILLAILAFGFSLVGTFIVRSGVLTSVHAFANDPERGVYILAILGIFTGGALLLYALRAPAMQAQGVFGVVSRESALVANNLLLAVSCFVVFIGTIWPLIAEMAFDRKLSVGPPFFNAAFTPFVIAIAIILPFGSLLTWKRGRWKTAKPLMPAAFLALAVMGLVWAMQTGRSLGGPLGAGLGVWLVVASIIDLMSRTGRGAWRERLGRATRLPRADWGKMLAHGGLGITIFGVAALVSWEQERIEVMEIGDTMTIGRYEVVLEDVRRFQGPNYISTQADLHVYENGRDIGIMQPEKRVYPVAQMPTTEAGIDNGFTRDVYTVIGDPQVGGGWAVRVYIKPFANWIWGGSIIMALGGIVSLTDRRYRVGAAQRRRPSVPSDGVPAE
ncbi:MAG: cytochrome c-type biogenesis CcmF C-terminal domain-containing protein, partial [Pseudomonadota bacterium]